MNIFRHMFVCGLPFLAFAPANAAPVQLVRAVVLVHGAFADGSGWRGVADTLERDGFKVSIVQEPETSLAADVAATRNVLDQQLGPVVLVGHSYGGAVITAAGNHPKVASLVYVAGFAPDEGETLLGLDKSAPTAGGHDIISVGAYSFVKPDNFRHDFAACLPTSLAHFMAISQVGQSISSNLEKFTALAWKSKPSYAIVASDDLMISPHLEMNMYRRAGAKITVLQSCHAVYIDKPAAVAEVIEQAARHNH